MTEREPRIDKARAQEWMLSVRSRRILEAWALASLSILAPLSLVEVLLREFCPVYVIGIPEAYQYDSKAWLQIPSRNPSVSNHGFPAGT